MSLHEGFATAAARHERWLYGDDIFWAYLDYWSWLAWLPVLGEAPCAVICQGDCAGNVVY